MVKLYLFEPGSNDFNRTVEGRTDVVVSDLAVTETVSALARRAREGAISMDTARRVHHQVLEALDRGVYQRVELTREVHRRAEHLLMSLAQTPVRAADALHLALAVYVHAASFASFDDRLSAAARAIGFTPYPA